MTTPKRVPSGWQVQVYLGKDAKGKSKFKTITHQFKWQVVQEAERLEENRERYDQAITVRNAIDKYIDISKDVLSPTTYEAYQKISQFAFQSIMDANIEMLTDTDMQQAINEESKRIGERTGKVISAKTVKNEWGLLSSALKHFGCTYNIRLPKRAERKKILPEPEQVISAIKGSDIELPCLLAMWCSLRISEILGIDCESIVGDTLCIHKVQVTTKDGAIVKEQTKTNASTRNIKIPPYLLEMINHTPSMIKYSQTGENQPLIAISNSSLRHKFYSLMKKNGLELSFHDLRHYFASISLIKLGIEDRLVQNVGGWKDSKVMREIYNNEFNSDQEQAFRKRNAYFDNLLNP